MSSRLFTAGFLCLVCLMFGGICTGQSPKPLVCAHAHNDYLHPHPLTDALECGFCSVEADIFLVEGELLVGHYHWQLNGEKTLRKLYLKPLYQRVQKNSGRVYPDGPLFTLLIDIKENGEQVYPVLKQQLGEFESMLSGLRNDKYEQKAIQIVISGDCPRESIKSDQNRLVSIDGRLGDLDSNAPAHLIPLISAPWGSNFKWRGRSKITDAELSRLNAMVTKAHAADRRVRFWASPESETVWQQLLDSDIDHINTDQLKRLQSFLSSQDVKREQ